MTKEGTEEFTYHFINDMNANDFINKIMGMIASQTKNDFNPTSLANLREQMYPDGDKHPYVVTVIFKWDNDCAEIKLEKHDEDDWFLVREDGALFKKNEHPWLTKENLKTAAKVVGLVALGYILGRKSIPYRKMPRDEQHFHIPAPEDFEERDFDAVNWFVNQQNKYWYEHHLVLAKDLKYKKHFKNKSLVQGPTRWS